MWRTLIAIAFAATIAVPQAARAQRAPTAREDDDLKKIQTELNKLQDVIKLLESRMMKALEAETPAPPGRPGGRAMPSPGAGPGLGGGSRGKGPEGGIGPGTDGPGRTGSVGGSSSGSGIPGIEARFRRLDRNGDGLLSADEMSNDLLREREQWDTNHDGFIDLNEFKAFIQAQMARNQQPVGGGGSGSATGGFGGSGGGAGGFQGGPGGFQFQGGSGGVAFTGRGAGPVSRVQALEAELNRLTETAKTIAERTKVVEGNLKEAKSQEEAASRAAKGAAGARSVDSKSSADLEKRLDRIEQTLEEIQRELRRKR